MGADGWRGRIAAVLKDRKIYNIRRKIMAIKSRKLCNAMSKKKIATIPLAGDKDSTTAFLSACEKMSLTVKLKGDNTGLFGVVEYDEPNDLYFLGANMVAESTGIFKGTLTR